MQLGIRKGLLLAVGVAAALAVTGCESSQKTTSSSSSATKSTEPAPARTTSTRWPTRSGDSSMAWTTLAYPTGNQRTSALGVEKGYPKEVRLNQEFGYDIIVTNLTDLELEDVVVEDEAGDHLKIESSTPNGTIRGGTGRWAVGTLGPRESRTIRVKATPTREGMVGTCATVSYNSQLCALVPVVSPKLALEKTGPSQVLKCDPITYRFKVTNTGSGTIRGVTINDPLPAGLTTDKGASSISFNVGDLRAGESKTYASTVQATRSGRFSNKATANSSDKITASSGDVVTVVSEPDLEVAITCPGNQYEGRVFTVTMKVTNNGSGEARDAVLGVRIPDGVQFRDATDGGSRRSNQVLWNLGTLRSKGTKTVSARFSAAAAGSHRFTSGVRSYCNDQVTDSCTVDVTGIPAILLEVVDIEDPVEVGNNTTYVITVTNQGSAPDTNIKVVATLEENQEGVTATGATRGEIRGRTITFEPIRSLAPKARAQLRVTVRNVKAGDVRFKVSMTSDQLKRPVEETEATNVYE